MTQRCLTLFLLAALATTARAASAAAPSETMAAPGFGNVALYAPDGPPEQVVLFVSGDGGWNAGVVAMAERIRGLGALVVGIDIRRFLRKLEAAKPCAYPAGALEELSRAVQLKKRLPAYHRPILVGYSSGATLVYGAIAEAPPETFLGAVSLGFCPDLEIRGPLCHSGGLRTTKRAGGIGYDLAPFAELAVPWHVLQGEADQVCDAGATRVFTTATGSAHLHSLPKVGHGFSVTRKWEPQFVQAYREIATPPRPVRGPEAEVPVVAGLGLEEVGAPAGRGDVFAVLLTGDGGWAEIDKGVARALAARGVPTVGWSSLEYYWRPRTPEGAAADLARVIEHYAAAWNKHRVLLVGYSFGADVLPFMAARLPEATASRVASIGLLGLSDTAAFAFHLTSWIGGGGDPRYPTAPEVARLRVPVACIQGSDEADSGCRGLGGTAARVVTIGHGHHFGGDYEAVVNALLADLRLAAPF